MLYRLGSLLAKSGEARPLVIAGVPGAVRPSVSERIDAAGLTAKVTLLPWLEPAEFEAFVLPLAGSLAVEVDGERIGRIGVLVGPAVGGLLLAGCLLPGRLVLPRGRLAVSASFRGMNNSSDELILALKEIAQTVHRVLDEEDRPEDADPGNHVRAAVEDLHADGPP